jgi:hypothetical protein
LGKYDEDAWSRWHCEDEYTGKEESSKESSFVVIPEGKGISSEAYSTLLKSVALVSNKVSFLPQSNQLLT